MREVPDTKNAPLRVLCVVGDGDGESSPIHE